MRTIGMSQRRMTMYGDSTIRIKKSATADTITTDHKVTPMELKLSTEQHQSDVKAALYWMVEKLMNAAYMHDYTKTDPEWFPKFYKDFTYWQEHGFDAEAPEKWFKAHVEIERHHLNDCVPKDVDLFDVLERIADCVMAGMGRSGEFDPEYGGRQFIDPDVLMKACVNTCNKLVDLVVVEDE